MYINRLQDELLSDVLLSVLSQEGLNRCIRVQHLRLVSTRWNKLTENVPSFWSFLESRQTEEAVIRCLDRSQHCPLHVDLLGDLELNYRGSAELLAKRVLASADRVRTLLFVNRSSYAEHAPRLQRVGPNVTALFRLSWPHLHHLHINYIIGADISIATFSVAPVASSSLCYLTLYRCCRLVNFLGILRHCPMLVSINYRSVDASEVALPAAFEGVALPRLRRFVTRGVRLDFVDRLRHVTGPSDACFVNQKHVTEDDIQRFNSPAALKNLLPVAIPLSNGPSNTTISTFHIDEDLFSIHTATFKLDLALDKSSEHIPFLESVLSVINLQPASACLHIDSLLDEHTAPWTRSWGRGISELVLHDVVDPRGMEGFARTTTRFLPGRGLIVEWILPGLRTLVLSFHHDHDPVCVAHRGSCNKSRLNFPRLRQILQMRYEGLQSQAHQKVEAAPITLLKLVGIEG